MNNYKYDLELVKIPAASFKIGDVEKLLRAAGAVNVAAKRAYPSAVYVHPRDAKKLQSAARKDAKRRQPYLRGRRLDAAVAYYWLGLGPNESDAVRQGYAIVDRRSIKFDNERDSQKDPGQL